jgi:hypothetical protein
MAKLQRKIEGLNTDQLIKLVGIVSQLENEKTAINGGFSKENYMIRKNKGDVSFILNMTEGFSRH